MQAPQAPKRVCPRRTEKCLCEKIEERRLRDLWNGYIEANRAENGVDGAHGTLEDFIVASYFVFLQLDEN